MRAITRRQVAIRTAAMALAIQVPLAGAAEPPKDPPAFKMAAFTALSGPQSMWGTIHSRGLKMAVDEINAAGGIQGIKIDLRIEDHQNKSDVAVAALNRVMATEGGGKSAGVPVVFPSFGAPTQAQLPLADQYDLLMMSAGGGSPALIQGSKYIFHDRMMYGAAGLAMFKRAKEFGKNLAVITLKLDLGEYLIKTTLPEWEKSYGGKVVAQEMVAYGATNIDTQVAKVKSANPDVVLLWETQPDTGLAIKRLREFGVKAPIIAIDLGAPDLKVAGNSAEGVESISDPFRPTPENPWSMQFDANFRKLFSTEPVVANAYYYEMVYIVAEAIKRSRAKGGDYYTGPRLAAEIRAAKEFKSVIGGTLHFAKDDTVVRPLALFKVEGGDMKFVRYIK